MAVRQYVGARYVPKFFDNGSGSTEWVNTVPFEPLTIVTHLGVTYTSKIPVPVGISINDTRYWAVTGNYNEQVEHYREEVETLREVVETLTNHHYLFIGDSYGVGSDSWVNKTMQYMGVASSDYTNMSVSGAGFNGGTSTFANQLNNFTGDRNKVTDIIIGGGLNDSKFNTSGSGYTALSDAINSFCTYAKNNFPNAKLYVAFMGNAFDNAPLLDGRTYDKRIWCKFVYEDVMRKNGANVISNADTSFGVTGGNFSADHIHPNSYGNSNIARTIANALTGGDFITTYPIINLGFIGADGITLSSGGHMKYYCDGYSKNINIHNVQFGTIKNINSSWTTLCTFSDNYWNINKIFEALITLSNYDGKLFQVVPGQIMFEGNALKIRTLDLNDANTGFVTHTSTSSTSFVGFNLESFAFDCSSMI